MTQLKDSEIKNIETGKQKKEDLPGKGSGSIVFRRKVKVITAYYRYWRGKQSIFIKLDNYRLTPKTPGKSLSELRDQALAMVALRKRIAPVDLKEYLQEQEAKQKEQREENKRKEEADKRIGTFEDLLMAYAYSLEERKASCAYAVSTMFETNLLDPYPELAAKPASQVTSEDLMPVLTTLIKRNSPGQYNSFRGYLSAAFNFGVKADFNPRENARISKRYHIRYNPVTPFPKEATKPRKRVLNHQELRQLWRDIDDGVFDPIPQYGLFVQFCIACFGNRPAQLARCKWSDVDLEQKTITFIDVKGRGKPRITRIPLTERAMAILKKIRSLPENYRFNGHPMTPQEEQTVFRNESFDPLGYHSVNQKITRYHLFCEFMDKREAQEAAYKPQERWTMKDFRRTAVGIMTDARILRESRYLLQSRTDGSIESRHYDVSDRMGEKWEAALKYDAMLGKILSGETRSRNCTPADVVKDAVIDDYQSFKQCIINNKEVMTQAYYRRSGYRETTIRRWFEQLVLDGVIRKSFERYVFVDPSTVKSGDNGIDATRDEGYQLFKQNVLDSGKLKQQKQYIEEGYSEKKIRRWFRRLAQENLIEKIHRRYYLKQPA